VGPGVAEVARAKGLALTRALVCDPHGLPVHRLQIVLAADVLELSAVRIVRERHHDISARPKELAMELSERVGSIQDDLRHVRPGLDVAPPLEFEDVALGAQHRATLQPLEDAALASS